MVFLSKEVTVWSSTDQGSTVWQTIPLPDLQITTFYNYFVVTTHKSYIVSTTRLAASIQLLQCYRQIDGQTKLP